MTLQELMKLQEEFDIKHTSNFNWNEKINDENIEMLEFLLISMFGEIGESIKEQLSEEIADIFIYLMKICIQLDIDLENSYLNKREKNMERFKKYEK